MTRTGRPRTFTEDSVVDIATDLFWQHGYGATSMNRLGKSAGVLPGSLHAAFGDKHALFVRALERYVQGQRDFGAALQDGRPVLPRLREAFDGIASAAGTAHPHGCMLGNTATELAHDDPAIAATVRNAFTELETSIATALARAQRDGEVAPAIDPTASARMLVALMQGLHLLARVETDPQRLREAAEAALAPLAHASVR
ncbi:MAG TPA: TetR/AcrR family transcriptional regulator [Pseudonocardiaceae bacterium]|nr:TetR/AcrR family transcriptional regulator [Pseudonocardiaceae bacterium]